MFFPINHMWVPSSQAVSELEALGFPLRGKRKPSLPLHSVPGIYSVSWYHPLNTPPPTYFYLFQLQCIDHGKVRNIWANTHLTDKEIETHNTLLASVLIPIIGSAQLFAFFQKENCLMLFDMTSF